MFCFLLLSFPLIVNATAQIPDVIIIEGETNSLISEPFIEYFRKNRNDIPKLEAFIQEDCSGSWRGFQAYWEIKDKRLYLTALYADPCKDNPTPIPLSTFFSNVDGPVHAVWYSGNLVIPQGKIIEYVHMGYESKYEKYLIITIEQGNVKDSKLTNSAP